MMRSIQLPDELKAAEPKLAGSKFQLIFWKKYSSILRSRVVVLFILKMCSDAGIVCLEHNTSHFEEIEVFWRSDAI